jgi:hypothetical protein
MRRISYTAVFAMVAMLLASTFVEGQPGRVGRAQNVGSAVAKVNVVS